MLVVMLVIKASITTSSGALMRKVRAPSWKPSERMPLRGSSARRISDSSTLQSMVAILKVAAEVAAEASPAAADRVLALFAMVLIAACAGISGATACFCTKAKSPASATAFCRAVKSTEGLVSVTCIGSSVTATDWAKGLS